MVKRLLKQPLYQFILTVGVLLSLILFVALSPLMVRTFGEDILFEGTVHGTGYGFSGGTVNFTLDAQDVNLQDVSDDALTAIEAVGFEWRISDKVDFYLHLNLTDNQTISSVYLDIAKPDDDTPYISINTAFLRTEDEDHQNIETITGVRVHFLASQQHYITSQHFDRLSLNRHDLDIVVRARIWRGNIQIIDISR